MALSINTRPSSLANSGNAAEASIPASAISPFDPNGQRLSRDAFEAHLGTFCKKKPLQDACSQLQLKVTSRASLSELRQRLLDHWYTEPIPQETPTSPHPPSISVTTPTVRVSPGSTNNSTHTPIFHFSNHNEFELLPEPTKDVATLYEEDPWPLTEEESLLHQYGSEGSDELLGYTHDGLEDEEDEEDEDESFNADEQASPFTKFARDVRTEAATRAEQNRRPGGRKAQKSVMKAWDRFLEQALAKGQVKDEIVDIHSLLLFIKWSAERPKLNRQGQELPGTFVGASQLKKLFFGALRIRKLQDAEDSTLARRRTATSVLVYDSIKERMDVALDRDRNGLLPNEDAVDITKNTFLAEITPEQLDRIGLAFLEHREIRMAINGHMAWTCQNATGNRGDDFRALKLCELQPYTWTHPNNETAVYSVLGLQGEEKAGKRGMKTKINPVYSVFAAHRLPESCPLGAIALYLHYLHDYYHLEKKMNIDWSLNKSWRQVRLLFGMSPVVAYNESNLYNLYVQAYKKAGFASNIKQHMPRRMLGYKQEQMGVDKDETSKLGWSRNSFYDRYAPALPKTAILAAHGYKVHEVYSPPVRHVHVPERFLSMICPMAEEICEKIAGKAGLSGAAIYQKRPNSPIFKLPAFQDPDVQRWMTGGFPSELARVMASEGSPVDLQRIQNAVLQQALEETRALLHEQTQALARMERLLQRRTVVLSPTQGFSNERYHSTASGASVTTPTVVNTTVCQSGIYATESGSLRACVNPPSTSPSTPTENTRQATQVDFVLPPAKAFASKGEPTFVWPPCLGKKGITWTEVFNCIKQPDGLWSVWGPSKSLNRYDLDSLWECYSEGEGVYDEEGKQTGKKPPLRLLEEHFQNKWRKGAQERKAWTRLKKIPQYIAAQSQEQGVSPSAVIKRLKDISAKEQLPGLSALSNRLTELTSQLEMLQAPSTPGCFSSSPTPSSPASLGSPIRLARAGTPTSSARKRRAASPLPFPGSKQARH